MSNPSHLFILSPLAELMFRQAMIREGLNRRSYQATI